jgi:signal transduction histidine kinase
VAVRTRTGDDRAATLPAAHQVVLLRAAQEALANVRKHAAATAVEIELRTSADGQTTIEVTDDGRGFEPGRDGRSGFGLAGMRGRVEEAGGQLHVDSAPGAGTQIRVLLPATAGASTPRDA